MSKNIRIGIVGASGYGGGELIRILANHPGIEITYLSSETYKGKDIGVAFPGLRGVIRMMCEGHDPPGIIDRCDLIFMAQHPGWAMKEAGKFLNAGKKVIDLSADFRLHDQTLYPEWYKFTHKSPELLPKAVYGLTEIYRKKIKSAQLLANPGCYVTGALLALAPLVKNDIIEKESIIVDSKSGVSGAGRSKFQLDYHFPELNESMRAYGVGTHRHTPEIEQELSLCAGQPITISFTPHLISITRGILTTAYGTATKGSITTKELLKIYKEFYADSPFIVMLDDGEYPSTKSTCGSNYCHIALKYDPRTNRVIAISALDNLVKGFAGEAIQNMNLMCGFEETTALKTAGVCP